MNARIVVIVLVILCLITWIRGGGNLGGIAGALPFSGNGREGAFEAGAVAMILIFLAGLFRLLRRSAGTADHVEEPAPVTDVETQADERTHDEDGGQP